MKTGAKRAGELLRHAIAVLAMTSLCSGAAHRDLESVALAQAAGDVEAGRFGSALESLEALVESKADSAVVRHAMGAALLARVRARSGTPGGLAEIVSWLPGATTTPEPHIDRFDVSQARSEFLASLDLEPGRIESWMGLALAEVRLGRTLEARTAIDEALELQGDDPAILLLAGNVAFAAGEYEAATTRFREALRVHRAWPPALKNLALTAEKTGHLERARELWRELLQDPQFGSEAAARLADLRDADAQSRPLLSGDFGEAADTARSDAERQPSERGQSSTKRRLRGIGSLAPVDTSPAGLGRVFMRLGDVSRAVAAFQTAIEIEPDVASHWSDLSAALLTRASRMDRSEDLVEALSAVEHAFALDSKSVRVRFNRALALERLHLGGAARTAWRSLAELESKDTASIAEAARRGMGVGLGDAQPREIELDLRSAASRGGGELEAFVSRHRPAIVEWIQEAALRTWVDGTPPPAGVRNTARRVAAALIRVADDHALSDALSVVEAYDEAEDNAPMRRAVASYFEATAHHAKDESEEAEHAFRALLEATDVDPERFGPLLVEAGLRVAVYEYFHSDIEASEARLVDLVTSDAAKRYPALGGQIEWMLGLIQAQRLQPERALEHYSKAQGLLRRAKETVRVAELDVRIANLLHIVGDTKGAWRHCHDAISVLQRLAKTRAQLQAFTRCGVIVRDMEYPRAALPLFDAAHDLARSRGVAAEVVHASLSRARMRHAVGRKSSAEADLGIARQALHDVPSGSFREQLAADLQIAEGRIVSSRDPESALHVLGAAHAYFSKLGADDLLTRIHLDRGQALSRLGRFDSAEAELLAGIGSYERHRLQLKASGRIAYFDRSRELFESIVRLKALAQNDPTGAWEAAERARARDLLDRIGERHDPKPVGQGDLQRRLPATTALVSFVLLDDQLLTWVLTSERLIQQNTPIDRGMVDSLVASMLRGTDPLSREGFRFDTARQLHRLLIQPVAAELKGKTTLVVIPDRSLHRLPFAALVDPETGRYLVETWEVAAVPSGTVLYHALERAQSVQRPSLLAIGDPELDRTEFPDLGRLPGARAEAIAIGSLYPGAKVLTGKDATAAAFRTLAPQYSVVHFAGHAQNEPEFPQESRLALASDAAAGEPGSVSVRSLFELEFPATRLVVLAACSTASGKVSKGEGSLSVVRPFLAAGAPSVVASLWNLEDAVSATFFPEFHKRWRSGESVASAIRRAQLDMLNSGEDNLASPSGWAAIQLFGSPSTLATTSW